MLLRHRPGAVLLRLGKVMVQAADMPSAATSRSRTVNNVTRRSMACSLVKLRRQQHIDDSRVFVCLATNLPFFGASATQQRISTPSPPPM